jgi:excisionase family DNA binding protein
MGAELVTCEELAQRLRVRPSTIRCWVRQGRIPAVRFGAKVIRFDVADVCQAMRAEPAPASGVAQGVADAS